MAFRVPADTAIRDSAVRAAARRGLALLQHTRDSLPGFVRAELACVSCHPRDGTQPNAMPWVGVYSRFPQYRSRSGAVSTLEDRINDCFQRSMNGRALPWDSRAMRDIVAYMAALSAGYPVGSTIEGQGLPRMTPVAANAPHGETVYAAQCARCHGVDGAGTTAAPPLWGSRSFNIGAGMARLRTAASFIRHNMPADQPGALNDQDAFDVAAYIGSHPRPDFPGKEHDWPNGDAPPDVAYPTKAARGGVRARRGP
jgi:thiosulfate dehydrogenase